MSWICGRKVTDEDVIRVDTAAIGFLRRHDLINSQGGIVGPLEVVEHEIHQLGFNHPELANYLWRLWYRCFARAVKYPGCTGIAYDYIGYSSQD